MVAEISNLTGISDGYHKTVAEIDKYKDSTISVPELSRLLGVKTTTINARFRREGIQPEVVGRTNYIPGTVALSLADMHRHALNGWPTLQEVSRKTGIKTGTLKARCEKGKLEGYVDLTKRLRVNPDEIQSLSIGKPERFSEVVHSASRGKLTANYSTPSPRRAPQPKPARSIFSVPSAPTTSRIPFTLPPAPEPRVQVITARDYGFPVANGVSSSAAIQNGKHPERKRGALNYDPAHPFSISECKVGKSITYEQYNGTILKLIPDPFNPAIKVAFPRHEEPLMREILLRVGR